MDMKKNICQITILILVTSLVGCMSPLKNPPVKDYSISQVGPSYRPIKSMNKTKRTLLVLQTQASPEYESEKMLYMKKPYQLESFALNKWAAPPAEMMMNVIVSRLRESNYFHSVVASPFSGHSDYDLKSKLISLRQEFLKKTSVVRIVMQVDVIDSHTNKVIASQNFQAVDEAPLNNPYSGVMAANRAAQTISKQIALFVIRSIALNPT